MYGRFYNPGMYDGSRFYSSLNSEFSRLTIALVVGGIIGLGVGIWGGYKLAKNNEQRVEVNQLRQTANSEKNHYRIMKGLDSELYIVPIDSVIEIEERDLLDSKFHLIMGDRKNGS